MQVIINKYKNKNIIVIEYNLSWSRISALFHENPASRTFFHHFTESRVFSFQVKKTNCCKSQNLTWTLALLTDILKISFSDTLVRWRSGGEKEEETKR